MKPISDVLYVVAPELMATVRAEMDRADAQPHTGSRSQDWMVLAGSGRTCQFHLVDSLDAALTELGRHYYNFLVVDTRLPPGSPGLSPLPLQLLDKIHHGAESELRYPLSRVIAVLPLGDKLALAAFELGKHRVGGFVTEPFVDEHLFDTFETAYDPNPGRTALCLSGGGVEGFLFELGVLKALNAHLQTRSITDFEIFCGISAGAILAAFLANRTEPEEIADAMAQQQAKSGSTIDPVTPGIIYDPHLKEYLSRLWSLAKTLPVRSWSEFVSSLLKTVPIGFFRGDALEAFLERQLTTGGRSNDFRQLKRELYIGATDQDTSTHVVFGDGQWTDVPIASAVRASIALTPFFEPAKIRGRYFVDGQYTRTSNFTLAVERGAKLVIVIDPLVPVRVDLPGYVRKKGGVFGGLQALKAVIHTRFLNNFYAAAEANPNVDFVLFVPEGDDMRMMSGSPMKYTIRTEIMNMAYRYAVRRIQRDFAILEGTFAKHGYRLQRHPRLRTPHRAV